MLPEPSVRWLLHCHAEDKTRVGRADMSDVTGGALHRVYYQLTIKAELELPNAAFSSY